MIKSPCKSCEKHTMDFPTCSENCGLLKDLQRINIMDPSTVRDSSKYVPSEGHSFANKSKHYKAMS